MTPPSNSPPEPPASASALKPGQAVGSGRYLLKQVLGQGGMGVVWLAHDTRLREPAALKFLPSHIAFDAVALADLRRETMRSRKLSHPNVVRIHDLNEAPNESTFISMEYVSGPNLHNLRASRPARVLNWKFLAPIVRQLCSALDYAHGEGIVHRDLKPANLMLDTNERLKLADFGVACVLNDSSGRASGHQFVRGTLDFMSPQQADGKRPQISDDIYSLGATLYDLLTSRPPFYTGDIGYQVRNTRPDPMEQRLSDLELSNDIPSDVSALIMACLAKDPEKRPASAKAILDWLDSAAAKPSGTVLPETAPAATAVSPHPPAPAPVTVAPPPPPPELPVPLPTATPELHPAKPQPPSRAVSRSALLTAAALVVVAVTVAGFWMARNKAGGSGPPASPSSFAPEKAEVLFNGRDLTGWSGDLQYWFVHDGAIVGRVEPGRGQQPSCLIWRGGKVQDFELRLTVRFFGGNSGIFYRARDLGEWNVGGYQFEIFSSNTGNLLLNGTDRVRRDLARQQKGVDVGVLFKKAEWNEVVITARGNRLVHEINGQVVADVTDTAPSSLSSGILAFELYGGGTAGRTSVEFKDIRLKRL